MIETVFEGTKYYWEEGRWVSEAGIVPPSYINQQLWALLADQISKQYDENTPFDELLKVAKTLRDQGCYEQAKELLRKAYMTGYNREQVIAVVGSVLRKEEKPEEVIKITQDYVRSQYPPILGVRAAAMCDLGKWDEALALNKRAMAIEISKYNQASEESHNVRRRIRNEGSIAA